MKFLVALMFLAQEVHGFGIVLLPTDRKGQKLPCIDNFLSEIQNIVYYFSTLFFANRTSNYADYCISLNWEIFSISVC